MGKNVLIISEGSERSLDRALLLKLIELESIPQPPRIWGKDSISEVIKYLQILHLDESITQDNYQNIEQVLIIVDADEDPQARYQEVKDALDPDRFNVEELGKCTLPNSESCINKIPVSVYLFPDCMTPGSIEKLLYESINEDNESSKKKECIEKYLCCLKNTENNFRSTENNIYKSKLRIYYSTPVPEYNYVARVINSLNLNSNSIKKLRDFLSN